LDGNFNANNNVTYGDPEDNVDLTAEVYVGRAPVDNYNALSNFVRKTIAYESTSTSDPYLTAIWMIGQYLEPMIFPKTNVSDPEDQPPETVNWWWGADYKNQTVGAFPTGFNIWTLYDKNYPGDDCNCNQNDWPRSELINRINEDYIHAINHIGCANFCDIVAYVMKMGYNHADALNNTKYFFGYSQAGYAASFDNRDPEGVYLPHDCVLEHFVTAPAGAFAFIGNSRYGLIDTNVISNSPSQMFDKAFWEEMFNTTRWNETGRPVTNIGLVNQLSKEKVIAGTIDNPNMRYCYYEINLLGDPETPFIIPAAVTLGTTVETPDAVKTAVPSPVAGEDAGRKTEVDSSLDMPDLFEGDMSFDFDANMDFGFEEGMGFGDPMNL
jgi:hypothetical protein